MRNNAVIETDLLIDLAKYVRDLTRPIHVAESFWYWRGKNRVEGKHMSDHPSLIEQLRRCATDRPQSGEDQQPARTVAHIDLDAIDRLRAIEDGVLSWCERFDIQSRSLRIVAPERIQRQIELDLPALVGIAPHMVEVDLSRLVRDAGRWWTWCRIYGGWEMPPMRPYVRCPCCQELPGARAGLRIRFLTQSAVCVSCDSTWDPSNIDTLARYIIDAGR